MSKQRKTATPPKPAKGNSDPKPQAYTPHETQQAEIRRSVFGNLPSHFFLLNRRPELFGDSPFRPSVPALLAWQRREDLWQRELGRHAPMSVGEIVEIGRGLTVPVPAKIEDRVAQLTDTGNTLDYMDNMLIAAIKNDRQPVAEVAAEKAQADKPGLDDDTHSADFRSVRWGGATYTFTSNQAACVRQWWEAMENGTPDVGVDTVLEVANTAETVRIQDVFRKHPAWGVLIVQGATKGAFRIAPKKK